MVREIPLTRGKVALVDDEDYERVAALKWSAVAVRDYWYARHAINRGGVWRAIKMHRFILDVPDDAAIDHVNRNSLDNRRCNLRIATRQQNAWNSPGRSDSTTGFKGVYRNPGGSFTAVIETNAGPIRLGSFRSAEEAARIYDAAVVILRGDFAWTNFSEVDSDSRAIAEIVLNGGQRPRVERKLTDADVIDIRRRYSDGAIRQVELADEYGVTQAAISHAVSGHTFSHITDPAPIRTYKRRKAAA